MDDAVEHMALFRRFVLNILKQSECGAPSQRNKLKKAGWNDDYRAQLFFGWLMNKVCSRPDIKRSLNFIKNMLNESIYVAYINKKSQQNQNAGFYIY